MWNKRVKAHLILIFSTNTNRESVAYYENEVILALDGGACFLNA
jgi:hypothetical protein